MSRPISFPQGADWQRSHLIGPSWTWHTQASSNCEALWAFSKMDRQKINPPSRRLNHLQFTSKSGSFASFCSACSPFFIYLFFSCEGKSNIHERRELFKQHRYLLRASLSSADACSSPRGGRPQIALLVISYRSAGNTANRASANPLNDALWCWSNGKKQEQRALVLPCCHHCWTSSPKPQEWSSESRVVCVGKTGKCNFSFG